MLYITGEITSLSSQANHIKTTGYKHCTPFKHDIRSASLCGVEFVVTKERREKRAQRKSCLKGLQRLLSVKRPPPANAKHIGFRRITRRTFVFERKKKPKDGLSWTVFIDSKRKVFSGDY